MPASPSTDNYSISRGYFTFQATGETAARDLGNIVEAEFTPNVETRDHFNGRTGTRSKDKTFLVEKGGELRIVMDEATAENLKLAVAGGDISTDTAGVKSFDILANNVTSGVVIFIPTNEIGPKIGATFNNVEFAPNGSISFITDEENQFEITGQVLVDGSGDFGVITVEDQA